MTNYHFKLGDAVRLLQERGPSGRAAAVYEVMALLPSEDSSPRYRLKTPAESFSRVAFEYMMTAVVSPEPARKASAIPAESDNIFTFKPYSSEESSLPHLATAAG